MQSGNFCTGKGHIIMKYKTIVITVVLLLVAGVLARPYIPFLNSNNEGLEITPEPLNVYEEATAQGEPIFLEFYASW